MIGSPMADIESEDMQPPGYSIPKILATIQEKGPLKAMDDQQMGPHVHLTYLLIMVAFIASIIGLIVLFVL
jgi:hypothetical protein